MMRLLCGLALILSHWIACAEEVQVAVAANFAAPMEKIVQQFEHDSGHHVLLSFGATGKFYAQIKNGAPFDILLAADQSTPGRLSDAAVPATQFTYAIGSLVLWSAVPGLVDPQGSVLQHGQFRHLAIASPIDAPYGAAAMQTLQALHLVDALSPRLVQGESIGQAYAFVATGNAELGFVALSQIWDGDKIRSGSAWLVPDHLYTPLRQDAILLKHGKNNPAALALLAYLKTASAQSVMRTYGYHF